MKSQIIMNWTRFVLSGTVIVGLACITDAKQTIPDKNRQKQIRIALVEHGYSPGKNWTQTVETLTEIAREHNWQTKHVPDARVLILLGLGNKHSNPEVLSWPRSRLE